MLAMFLELRFNNKPPDVWFVWGLDAEGGS